MASQVHDEPYPPHNYFSPMASPSPLSPTSHGGPYSHPHPHSAQRHHHSESPYDEARLMSPQYAYPQSSPGPGEVASGGYNGGGGGGGGGGGPHEATAQEQLQYRNTSFYQNQLDKTTMSQAENRHSDSKVLVMSPHCPAALSKPSWNVKQFDLKKVLYVGNISRVIHAVDQKSGLSVALKVYKRANLTDMEKYQVAREIRMHSELHHTNIISLYCAWKDPCYVYMAVEWAPGGDLYSMLSRKQNKGLGEATVIQKVMKPLLAALSFIHSRGLIHRDLKPENILLDSYLNVKLSDFGLSINLNHEVANTRLGTLDYIAPEVLHCPFKHHPLENKSAQDLGYDNKVDVWSTGVLAYELLVGRTPFRAATLPETLSKIKQNAVTFPHALSPLAVDFVSLCLQSSPSRRPSVDQLLTHPWLSDRGAEGHAQQQQQQVPLTLDDLMDDM